MTIFPNLKYAKYAIVNVVKRENAEIIILNQAIMSYPMLKSPHFPFTLQSLMLLA